MMSFFLLDHKLQKDSSELIHSGTPSAEHSRGYTLATSQIHF